MGRLTGKVAIVTGAGAAGNIGFAICDAFLREGAAGVVATDLSADHAEEISDQMAQSHGAGRFLFLQHNVAKADDWARVCQATIDEFGGLDVLVNNAGISLHGSIMDLPKEDLDRVMEVNFGAIVLGMKACVPALGQSRERHRGGGSIINTLSVGAYMPNTMSFAYSASKAAARMLTLCAADEFGPQGIRVNSVHPGVTKTPMIERGMQSMVKAGRYKDEADAERGLGQHSPLGIVSDPEDLAHAFVYLASDEARFVTGQAFVHDGGIRRQL
ncbi:SDR family NAD(P)-dependent oxidoreductase [Novosphingobium pentaromativorans]|uniref:Short-chain dehydrogenase/reductase SDR n=1 Tax=Novosphingobium pentaromativorans US6-1 TaxID=1088721 RepID=G6EAU2_9SPHN|nr:SDR family oxidoreductase [Novosphingobium pentaromativorans]AIT80569.1 cyclopentanol dehydrogenase [Novosphingobium pentaromativorans US6-1]EHJ61729.1 hypothetical protein NSU_1490 [Novosphingobium pentaromativorans US6-1]